MPPASLSARVPGDSLTVAEISLFFRKYLFQIYCGAALGLVITSVWLIRTPPLYQASSTWALSEEEYDLGLGGLDNMLYPELAESESLIRQLEMPSNSSHPELRAHLFRHPSKGKLATVELRVRHHDPEVALQVASHWSAVFQNHLEMLVQNRLNPEIELLEERTRLLEEELNRRALEYDAASEAHGEELEVVAARWERRIARAEEEWRVARRDHRHATRQIFARPPSINLAGRDPMAQEGDAEELSRVLSSHLAELHVVRKELSQLSRYLYPGAPAPVGSKALRSSDDLASRMAPGRLPNRLYEDLSKRAVGIEAQAVQRITAEGPPELLKRFQNHANRLACIQERRSTALERLEGHHLSKLLAMELARRMELEQRRDENRLASRRMSRRIEEVEDELVAARRRLAEARGMRMRSLPHNIRQVAAPVLPGQPLPRQGRIKLIMGGVLGMLFGIVWAMGREYRGVRNG